jgi:MFS family permease
MKSMERKQNSRPAGRNPILSSKPFRRLWVARTISHMGDGIALVALVLIVQSTRGTGTAVGALLLASALPRFLGPFTGALADRIDQRRLMIACDVGNAAVFAIIATLNPSFAGLLALVAASGMLDALFAPAGRSAVPALVEPGELVQANAWMGTSLNLQVALGTLVGGALVAAVGARGALAVNAFSFLISAATLFGLPPLHARVPETSRGFLAVGTEGLAYAWRTRLVRGLVITLFLGVAFAAVDNVALVFLVRETLGGGPLAFGLASAAFGAGMIAVSIRLSWRPGRFDVGVLLVLAWFASGIGAIATGLAPVVAAVAAGQAIGGFGNGVQNIAADTLIQRAVPAEMLGRVFGLVSTAAIGGSTVAYAAGGIILDLTSPRAVFLIGGFGVIAVTAFLWRFLRHELRSSDPARGG